MIDGSGKERLLVSGMMRSGTTLLQRALDCHPVIDIWYQSRTESFLDMKRDFLLSIGFDSYHPLSHYDPEPGYAYRQFKEWAAERSLAALFPDSTGASITGVKEVLVEEFYPLLLERSVLCLNIVRDPRDVITSMSFGDGWQHTGRSRPVLFDLRNWRKSVHFGSAMESNGSFRQIRFEDLLVDTNSVLGGLLEWMGVHPLEPREIEAEMVSRGWSGNSSFGHKSGFDRGAIGGHVRNLPAEVTAYVEAVCWREMERMGYSVSLDERDREEVIKEYRDPFVVDRDEFEKGYSSSPENVRYEIERAGRSFIEIQRELFK